ncbi:carbohydrate kinase family protein [Rhizobium leguminosarum]|uniref:carbohydrate kinase family protein n=1 Tax=Rhizobium leguminosarum TaxID=384 RepID=UPI001F32364E|nr:PfkB family carbohydrate kinase [Rhizobium leguminosarum]UIJ83176.1 PfkB family carbohydrate kinase [Rhizobium leguminosarum]
MKFNNKISRDSLKAYRILVIGSLNVDVHHQIEGDPEDDGCARIVESSVEAGGHAFNCASVLAKLGVQVDLAAVIGDDEEGVFLSTKAREAGVASELIQIAPGRASGKVFIQHYPSKRVMLFQRGASEHFDVARLDCLMRQTRYDITILCDAGDSATNIASFISSPHWIFSPGAFYSPRDVSEIAQGAKLLIVNRQEAKAYDLPAPSRLQLRVIVTQGDIGASLYDVENLHLAPPDVNVVDPTGAGDAFVAAAALGILADLPPRELLSLANTAGALATRARGARGSLPTYEELFGQ